jgi:hypothetical protein
MKEAIYLFWSQADVEVFGFTADVDGQNLPAEFAPWERNGDGACLYAGPGESLPVSDPVRLAIQSEGFYLCRNGPPAEGAGPANQTLH